MPFECGKCLENYIENTRKSSNLIMKNWDLLCILLKLYLFTTQSVCNVKLYLAKHNMKMREEKSNQFSFLIRIISCIHIYKATTSNDAMSNQTTMG